jgi:hypothetical protein
MGRTRQQRMMVTMLTAVTPVLIVTRIVLMSRRRKHRVEAMTLAGTQFAVFAEWVLKVTVRGWSGS